MSAAPLLQRLVRRMRLDATAWAQLAHPLGAWVRLLTGLPLVVLAVWSRVWIGWWAVLPAALALLWLWLTHRLFGPAADDRAWITRAVLGQRLWAERHLRPVPFEYYQLERLTWAVGIGAGLVVFGVSTRRPMALVMGVILAALFRVVILVLCARLYAEMVRSDPSLRYRPAAAMTPGPTATGATPMTPGPTATGATPRRGATPPPPSAPGA